MSDFFPLPLPLHTFSWNAGRGEQFDPGKHGADGDQVSFLCHFALPFICI